MFSIVETFALDNCFVEGYLRSIFLAVPWYKSVKNDLNSGKIS